MSTITGNAGKSDSYNDVETKQSVWLLWAAGLLCVAICGCVIWSYIVARQSASVVLLSCEGRITRSRPRLSVSGLYGERFPTLCWKVDFEFSEGYPVAPETLVLSLNGRLLESSLKELEMCRGPRRGHDGEPQAEPN